MVFELDPPQPQHTNTRSPSSPNTGRCISRKRMDIRTMEFPSINWDWHGQQHSHIYACADTVNDDLHWGPTQSVLKISFDTADMQVSWVSGVRWGALGSWGDCAVFSLSVFCLLYSILTVSQCQGSVDAGIRGVVTRAPGLC